MTAASTVLLLTAPVAVPLVAAGAYAPACLREESARAPGRVSDRLPLVSPVHEAARAIGGP
ncbi:MULTISPECIES: hypothetical protein [Streptomyces]|uniref:Uncharacterized protein n=1 Tax=Streptomyces nymphaeiformis TaxID=2663842 RepID=A0A7W7U3V4_9ACTN|nr:hypothetical protein [Streptomyces nymphaeiformis]MBB4984486.1 hypothetical protein [Streptomyces nymphaeiformis]